MRGATPHFFPIPRPKSMSSRHFGFLPSPCPLALKEVDAALRLLLLVPQLELGRSVDWGKNWPATFARSLTLYAIFIATDPPSAKYLHIVDFELFLSIQNSFSLFCAYFGPALNDCPSTNENSRGFFRREVLDPSCRWRLSVDKADGAVIEVFV